MDEIKGDKDNSKSSKLIKLIKKGSSHKIKRLESRKVIKNISLISEVANSETHGEI